MVSDSTERLSSTEFGDGMPLVLLHGFPLNRTMWSSQHVLGDRFRVITPDLRGHGQSPVSPVGFTINDMAHDVLDLLDRLKIDRAILMGHSMGGYVTLAAWAAAPTRFAALGLICTQAGADTDEAKRNRLQLADKVGLEGAQVVEAAMALKLFAPGISADNTEVTRVRQMILSTPVRGIQGALNALASRPDRTAELSSITVPVLVMTGEFDQLIAPAKAEAMAHAIPSAQFIKVSQSGHLPMLEQPAAVNSALRDFACGLALARR